MGPDIALDSTLAADGSRVLIDGAEFDQVIVNLILNARDSMPDGGRVTLNVMSRQVAATEASAHGVEAGTFVEVSVSDIGAGIAAAVLDEIFEPFFTTKGPTNAGLGLSTVHRVSEEARGWVDVQSVVGAGATFRVTLPVTATRTIA